MIITNRYWLEKNGTACFSSRAKRSIPPVLSAKLRCSNMVIAGEKLSLYIRRLKCPHCLRIHHELPDFLVPYKRFIAACIEIAIGKQYDRLSCENSTIYRWRIWFQRLCIRNQISSLDFNKKGWLPQLIFLLWLKEEK